MVPPEVPSMTFIQEGSIQSIGLPNKFWSGQKSPMVLFRNSRFIKKLKELDLIEISEEPFGQKVNPQLLEPFPWLTFIWLEITSKCNLFCLHCYGDCFAGMKQGSEMGVEEWKGVIDQGKELKCGSLQFIGGEPLLHPSLFDLVTHARKKDYTFIEIFSNLTLYKQEFTPFLMEHGVHIATTLYSSNPETHDRITQCKGSQEKTIEAILHLRESGIPLRVAIITMRQNQDDLKETVEFLRQLGVDFKMPDPVRPTGRGCSREIIPQNLPREFSGRWNVRTSRPMSILFDSTSYTTIAGRERWPSQLKGR